MKKIITIFFLLLLIFCFTSYIFKKWNDNKTICDCTEKGFFVEQSFSINGILGSDMRNAKVLVFDKKSAFEKIIDSTLVELIDNNGILDEQTTMLNETKVDRSYNYSAKFKKPITTNADWIFSLNNGKKIKVTNIKNHSNYHAVMFKKLYFCSVCNLKINGIKNDTLISGIRE